MSGPRRFYEVPHIGEKSSSKGAIMAFTIMARFPRGFTVEQLMAEFGMSKATAFRYVSSWKAVHPLGVAS